MKWRAAYIFIMTSATAIFYLLAAFSYLDVWKVIIVSGVYTPKEPLGGSGNINPDSQQPAAEDEEDPDAEVVDRDEEGSKNDEEKQLDDQEEGENNEDEEAEDEEGNTNNNALDGKDSEDEDNPGDEKPPSPGNEARPHPPQSKLGIVIYGDLGKSALLPLNSDEPAGFQPGVPDEFHVSLSKNDSITRNCL